jgi:hypothetical protein
MYALITAGASLHRPPCHPEKLKSVLKTKGISVPLYPRNRIDLLRMAKNGEIAARIRSTTRISEHEVNGILFTQDGYSFCLEVASGTQSMKLVLDENDEKTMETL